MADLVHLLRVSRFLQSYDAEALEKGLRLAIQYNR